MLRNIASLSFVPLPVNLFRNHANRSLYCIPNSHQKKNQLRLSLYATGLEFEIDRSLPP